jgi:hypothetical protein
VYLYVFVFLLMGILGLYTQVFSLQTARMFAHQTAIAQTMLFYHNTSYMLARNNYAAVASFTGFCYQTYNVSSNKCTWGTLSVGNNQYNLPASYNADGFAFPSVVYEKGGMRYLLTYAAPPSVNAADPSSTAGSPITTPRIGLSTVQLFRQMRNTGVSPMVYGTVNGSTFYSGALLVSTSTATTPYTMTYPLLTTIGVPTGAVGYISTL